jgi:hypothetical protein
MIPRTIDAAKVASVADQQAVTQQQQLAAQLKQTAAEQQQQVLATKPAEHDGKVSTEDLNKEKPQQRQHKKRDDRQTDGEKETAVKVHSEPQDPVRGHMIDIKT